MIIVLYPFVHQFIDYAFFFARYTFVIGQGELVKTTNAPVEEIARHELFLQLFSFSQISKCVKYSIEFHNYSAWFRIFAMELKIKNLSFHSGSR